MEFDKVIQTRRAVRKYKKNTVPAEKLQKLYEALRTAPTGSNRQPFKFIFVQDQEARKAIVSKACHQEFLYDAPILMVACCEKGKSFDVAIAVDHMILEAVNQGLGTCWVGWFEAEEVRNILGIPKEMDISIMVPIGFADESPDARPRKSIEELISLDRY